MIKLKQKRQAGFTLNEVLMSAVILGIFLVTYLNMDSRTWLMTKKNRNMMAAGHMVEQYIENVRMHIAQDTAANFPPADTAYTEGNITLTSVISPALSPIDAADIVNVRKVDLKLVWGELAGDTLEVVTYIARDF